MNFEAEQKRIDAEFKRIAEERAKLQLIDERLMGQQAGLLIGALALFVLAAPIAALISWWLG